MEEFKPTYRIRRKDDHLAHYGVKGSKWGYSHGKRNGKRTALAWDEYEDDDGNIYKQTDDPDSKKDGTYYKDKSGNITLYDTKTKKRSGFTGRTSTRTQKIGKKLYRETTVREIGKETQLINKGKKWLSRIFG